MNEFDEWKQLINLLNRASLAACICIAAVLLFALTGCTPGVMQ